MERWLPRYLLITGVLTIIVVSEPSVIILGMLAFLLPGLILYIAPTAFLWGLVFAACHRLLPNRQNKTSIGMAAVATCVLMTVLPWASNVGNTPMEANPSVVPSAPLSLSGDILTRTPRPPWDQRPEARLDKSTRPYNCDAVCLALLFHPGVRSVTVDKTGEGTGRAARTFRLESGTPCVGRVVEPVLNTNGELFGDTTEARSRRFDHLRRELSSGRCVVSDAPLTMFDMELREVREFQSPTFNTRWSWSAPPPSGLSMEIVQGDATVALHEDVTFKALGVPLMLSVEGDLQTAGFGWARTARHNDDYEQGPTTLEEGLRRWTRLPESLSMP